MNMVKESFYEKKDGKYYVYVNGVRHQVSKETYEQYQEDDRQEKIHKMNQRDKEGREKNKQNGWFNESKTNKNIKQSIKLNEKQLRKMIAESVKGVLREAKFGRGTETVGGSSWSGDEYGGVTTRWGRTRENPYRSDAVMMLANRFEKLLGNDFEVEAHLNSSKKEGYDNDGDWVERPSLYGSMAQFVIHGCGENNFEDLLFILTQAKKMFSNRDMKVSVENDDFETSTVTLSVEVSDIVNKEPRTTMIPKRAGDSAGGHDTPFANSNFEKPSGWSYTEN